MAAKDRIDRWLLSLGLIVVIIMMALSFMVRKDNIAAGSFHLDEAVVCDDLDDALSPIEPKEVFPAFTKQICLWFEYSRGRDGDVVDVLWFYEREDIQREEFRLLHPRGTKAFYLQMDDGSSLASGNYAITILCNGKIKAALHFVIESYHETDDPDAASDDEEME